MLPSPSRLKSLASELSPVFTTPPPVEPKTVLVLMSVPEIMLSSNLVVLRLRAAMMAATPPSTIKAPPPTAQVGVLPNRSSMNEGSGTFFGSTFGIAAVVSGALLSTGVVSGALASGVGTTAGVGAVVAAGGVVVAASGGVVVVAAGGVGVIAAGGVVVAGGVTTVVVEAGGVMTVGGGAVATCVSGALGVSAAVLLLPASAFDWRSDIVPLLSAAARCRSRTVF